MPLPSFKRPVTKSHPPRTYSLWATARMTAHQPRKERQEIPFRLRRREHVAGVDAERMADRRELVHECDVEVALGIFDHFGGLRDLDRGRAMDASLDCRAVDLGHRVERLAVLGGYDFRDRLEAMRLVARIDSLRRIADGEVTSADESRCH